MDLASVKTIHNQEKSRFELRIDGFVALIDYKVGKSGKWYLVHTEVPKEIGGAGTAHKIVRETLQLIDEVNGKIVPSCPFIRKFIKDRPGEYDHMLAEGVKL